MTFKEQYSLDNEKLHVDPDMADRIVLQQKKREKNRAKRAKIVRFGSLAACFVLIGAGLLLSSRSKRGATMYEGTPALDMAPEMAEAKAAFSAGAGTADFSNENIRPEYKMKSEPNEAFAAENGTETGSVAGETEESLEEMLVVQEVANDSIEQKKGTVRKEILLLIPLFVLIMVMLSWALFRKRK